MSIAIAGLLIWASRESDSVAVERQSRLVRLVVAQLRATIAHNQESVTVWDDAVQAVRTGADWEWLDYNLGSWMHTYFGHNGAYVLNPSNEITYAFASDAQNGQSAFASIEKQVAPLVAELRQDMRSGQAEDLVDQMLSPGAADITVVRNHPAVVSVKPIVSDTGKITQVPGQEYLHVAVRYLDGDFLDELEHDYLLDEIRFDWSNTSGEGETGLPLTARSGEVIGYFIWQPYKPGSAVLSRLMPVLVGALLLVIVVMSLLLAVLHQRSKKLHASEARMKHLAHHDPLTGLPNRVLLNECLDRELSSRRSGDMVAVLYLDLDRFKQVNDALGHPSGDILIIQLGERLCTLARPADIVARVGGDEFVVILPQIKKSSEVDAFCERAVEAFREPFELHGQKVYAGLSIGVALSPAHGVGRTELMRKADIALYHAKEKGGGRYAIFGAEMDRALQERQQIEQDLRVALTGSDEIQVYYQPLFSAAEMRVTGAEALVRWNHPTNGWMMPNAFVHVAEEAGLIETLGEYVLRAACKAVRSWPDQIVAVNVSAIELRNPAFVKRVSDVLEAYEISPDQLELEVTEGILSDNTEQCEENVGALRRMGVRVALDDFGTGFSSFGRLQRLEVDRIKIDQSFVRGIGNIPGDEAIVQAIVDLAHAKGLKTTAEGVETMEQGRYLKRIGCDDLQGFLYSRPISLMEMDSLLGVERRQASIA